MVRGRITSVLWWNHLEVYDWQTRAREGSELQGGGADTWWAGRRLRSLIISYLGMAYKLDEELLDLLFDAESSSNGWNTDEFIALRGCKMKIVRILDEDCHVKIWKWNLHKYRALGWLYFEFFKFSRNNADGQKTFLCSITFRESVVGL